MDMTPRTFHAVPLPSVGSIESAQRAVIDFHGLDQGGPSYEGRVFLNNPDAGPDTPTTPEHGYAGSFHVYGYGMAPSSEQGGAASLGGDTEARLPMRRYLLATDAVQKAAAQAPDASVTIVPVAPGAAQNQAGVAPIPVAVAGVTIHTNEEGTLPSPSVP